jgi:K+ transporter
MQLWREKLFVQLSRSAARAARFFSLPTGQVFEVGTPVEI